MRQGNKTRVNWDGEKDNILLLYAEGESTRSIGETYGVSHVTICKVLARWGVARRNGDSYRHIGEVDMTGMRFGKLSVLYRIDDSYPPEWWVLCDCGKRKGLTRGKLLVARSCGCGPRGRWPGEGGR